MGVIGILSVPLLYLTYLRVRDPFIPMNWVPPLSPHEMVDVFHRLSGRAEISGPKGGRVLLLAVFAACVSFVWCAWRGRAQKWQSPSRWPAVFLLLWLLTPALVLVGMSVLHPILLPRYALVSLPALMLVVAEGIRAVPRVHWRWVIVVGLCALNAAELLHYYQFRAYEGSWRDATASILKQAHAGDGAIFCVAPGRLLFAYYANEMSPAQTAPESIYPRVQSENDPTNLAYLPLPDEMDLNEAIGGHDRIWVVMYQDGFADVIPVRNRLQADVSGLLNRVSEEQFGDVRILLYAKPTRNRGL